MSIEIRRPSPSSQLGLTESRARPVSEEGTDSIQRLPCRLQLADAPANPCGIQAWHQRLRRLRAQHTGASHPTALRRHRGGGRVACRQVNHAGAKPAAVSDRHLLLGRSAPVLASTSFSMRSNMRLNVCANRPRWSSLLDSGIRWRRFPAMISCAARLIESIRRRKPALRTRPPTVPKASVAASAQAKATKTSSPRLVDANKFLPDHEDCAAIECRIQRTFPIAV
jgi:hypothetical protein